MEPTTILRPRPWLRLLTLLLLASTLSYGLPPRPAYAATVWRATVGGQTPDLAVQALAFLPAEMTVDVGDSVTWTFPSAEPHTVTLVLPFGTANTTPEICNGANASTGTCTWDGHSSVNSGRVQDDGTYTVTFGAAVAPGDYLVLCLLHRQMTATLHVQATNAAYPHDQAFYDQQADAQRLALLTQGVGAAGQQAVAAAAGPADRVTVGSGFITTAPGGAQSVQIPRFFATQAQNVSSIPVGGTITWSAQDPATPHTVTFGPEPANTRVPTANVTNGRAALPTSPSGQSVNSGFLGQGQPSGTTFSVTFTGPGVYPYYCALHDEEGMFGTVVVGQTVTATGGTGFQVSSQGNGRVALAWQGGTAQTGYRLTRTGATGDITLPAPAASATGATDALPAGTRVACYRLEALNATGTVIGSSDVECVVQGVGFGAGPANLAIQLNQGSSATLSWGVVAGATGYVVVPLGSSRVQTTTSTTAQDNTGGSPSCYLVAAVNGPALVGLSDAVCGVPGGARFS